MPWRFQPPSVSGSVDPPDNVKTWRPFAVPAAARRKVYDPPGAAEVLRLLSDHNRPGGKRLREEVSQMAGLHINSVDRIRKRFCQEGPQKTIVRQAPSHPPVPRKIDGKMEAQVVAICCSPAPEGRTRWTLKLLVNEMVHRRIVTSIATETVRKALKKTHCNPGGSSAGALRSGIRRGS